MLSGPGSRHGAGEEGGLRQWRPEATGGGLKSRQRPRALCANWSRFSWIWSKLYLHMPTHRPAHTVLFCMAPAPQTYPQVYVIGETGILEELDLKGIRHVGGPGDADKKVTLKSGEFMEHDHDVSTCV